MRPFITLGLSLLLTLLLTACSTDSLLERGTDLLDQLMAGDRNESRLTITQEPAPSTSQPAAQEPTVSEPEPVTEPEPSAAPEPAVEPQEPAPTVAEQITPSYTDATFFGPGESFLYVPKGISGVYACTYATEDEDIASVDQTTGRVTAVGPGTTKVTMHVEYNGQYDFECVVRCNWQDEPSEPKPAETKPAETKPSAPSEPALPAETSKPAGDTPAITASHTDATFFGPREKFRLRPVGAPDGASVTYTTADPDVAAVDINGNVTAIGPGTTTVTMTVDGGGTDYIFECIVRCKWSTESE